MNTKLRTEAKMVSKQKNSNKLLSLVLERPWKM